MYCNINDIKDVIPETNIVQLTNDDPDQAVIDQAKVDAATAGADELINGYLRGHFAIPLNPVPELVKKIAVDISIYNLYSRRYELEMPETMGERYKNAIKMLEQIQKGTIKIIDEPVNSTNNTGAFRTNKSASDRIFDRDFLDKF